MKNRRVALVFLALPLAFYAYACSSSDDGGGSQPSNEGGPNPGTDSGGGGQDSASDSPFNFDSGGDGGDGGGDSGPTCIGNPLTADGGGTPDGGVGVDGGAVRQILVAVGNTFFDGPQWVDTNLGTGPFLVYSDVFAKQVFKIGPDGGATASLRNAGNDYPIGNAVKGDFILTTVANENGNPGAIFQTRIDGGANGASIDSGAADNPNDLVVTPNGTLLVTDPQYQKAVANVEALYKIATDGGVSVVQSANIFRPNGIALTADGKTLYVGQGPLAGDPSANTNRKILKYAVAADGTVTAPGTTFIDSTALGDVPDGIAVDIGGNLWVAEAAADGSTAGRVEVFSPTGAKLGTILFPGARPTGVAFGGTDGKGVYITAEKGIYVYNSRCVGVK